MFAVHALRADEKPMMKAVVAHEYGAPEVLKFEEVPQPEPKEDEVLVRVIAGGVNPADPLTLGGKYAQEWGTHLPLIPGYEIAGIVEKTGAQVTTLKKGDAVYGYPNFGGGWAEYVAVKEWEVAPCCGPDGRLDRVASVGEGGASPIRPNRSDSWRLRRRR